MKEKNDKQFEKRMQRLGEIVRQLESPDVSLEEGMKLYREGAQCSRQCREMLEKARHELEIWENGKASPADAETISRQEQPQNGELE